MRTLLSTAALARCHGTRGFATSTEECISLQGVRGVLRLTGEPVLHFLQGLVTNNVTLLESPGAAPLYACLLNAQGRHLHDMFIHRLPGNAPVLCLDVDAEGLPDLVSLLKRYRLRQRVDIADVSGELSVLALPGTSSQPGAEPAPEEWHVDPRLPVLGLRRVGPWTEAAAEEQARYALGRTLLGVPEGDTEIPHGHAMPLEYNLDALHAVAYDKGCYIGQELVARTHYKGVIRKRLMPVAVQGVGKLPQSLVGADVVSAGSAPGSRAQGTLRALRGDAGLALLRLDAALPAAAGAAPPLDLRCPEGQRVTLKPSVPDWWPRSWVA